MLFKKKIPKKTKIQIRILIENTYVKIVFIKKVQNTESTKEYMYIYNKKNKAIYDNGFVIFRAK